MSLRAVIALFFLTGSVMAALRPPSFLGTEVMVESQSRQFIVHGPAGAGTPLNQAMRTQSKDLLRLDPSATAVTADRVKDALLIELGVRDRFERKTIAPQPLEPGRITLHLSPLNREPVQVMRTPVTGGWTYRLELPLEMTAHSFNSALVQVLLVDLANPPDSTAVDLPLWLSAGLLAHLEESTTRPLFFDTGLQARVESRGETLTARVTRRFRTVFQTRSALSFDELSWPGTVANDEAGLFTPSAQFFVYQLLQLDDGRDCLRSMVEKLSRYHNWQFAFYDAFSAHFKEPKEVEKWWAVQLAALTGRDASKLWTLSRSLDRLQEVLRVPVQIQASKTQLPESSAISLQTAVASWDYSREMLLLGRVVRDLEILRQRVAPEAVELVDAYRGAINHYRDQRDPLQRTSRNKSGTPSSVVFEQKSFEQRLDQIDSARAKLLRSSVEDLALHEAERRVATTNALQRAGAAIPRSR
jgi:hypothetical protein